MLSFNWNNFQAVGGIGGILLPAVKPSWYLYASFVKIILFIKRPESWEGRRLGSHSSAFRRWFLHVWFNRAVLETLTSQSSAFTFPSSAHHASEKLSTPPRDGSGDSPRQASPQPRRVKGSLVRVSDAFLPLRLELSQQIIEQAIVSAFSHLFFFFPFLYNYPPAN